MAHAFLHERQHTSFTLYHGPSIPPWKSANIFHFTSDIIVQRSPHKSAKLIYSIPTWVHPSHHNSQRILSTLFHGPPILSWTLAHSVHIVAWSIHPAMNVSKHRSLRIMVDPPHPNSQPTAFTFCFIMVRSWHHKSHQVSFILCHGPSIPSQQSAKLLCIMVDPSRHKSRQTSFTLYHGPSIPPETPANIGSVLLWAICPITK